MNNIEKYNKCAYCGACINACPQNAISVNKDSLYYALSVDRDKCINCGKCLAICPVNVPEMRQHLISGYAGYYANKKVRCLSSSGGLFYAISQLVLEKGGVVYGAVFSEDCHSVSFSSTDEVALSKILKSKYVESDIGFTFKRIERDLLIGRFVLFCGTPCQAFGLKRYLGKEYENLLVCDFSCGGLPSHAIFESYITDLERRNHSETRIVDFRPKNYGWENHSIYIEYKNGRNYTRLATIDPYFKAFFHNLSKRDYCYECGFANNHASDIILADLWRYKQISDYENDHLGLSLILTNSEKGEEVIKELIPNIVLKEINLCDASYNIIDGKKPEAVRIKHSQFLSLVEEKGAVAAINEMEPSKFVDDFKQWIKQIVKRGKYEGSEEDWN